jgi:NAD(P)H dehydrogenase (quinone)
MTALVVVAHPDSESMTHQVGRRVSEALKQAGVDTALADLHAEQFDPRFTIDDRKLYRGAGPVPTDVAAEQNRLNGADDVVLVFPVYWWSMPALLKGWIDRVFVNGWAFDDRVSPLVRKLDWMTIHLVMLAGEDAEGFRRRGYDAAITTQIVTGILGYCGARTGITAIVHESESRSPDSIEREIETVAASVANAVRPRTNVRL